MLLWCPAPPVLCPVRAPRISTMSMPASPHYKSAGLSIRPISQGRPWPPRPGETLWGCAFRRPPAISRQRHRRSLSALSGSLSNASSVSHHHVPRPALQKRDHVFDGAGVEPVGAFGCLVGEVGGEDHVFA